ncbi:MAG: phosphoribosyltransferase [Nitrososphaeria archaeon]|nr:phosphoribosyltransferase [Aigarchaeota archaeon]MCX8187004.1 phosphoribosyltransferase [Nitrososphaeria archaeon]
MKILEVGGFKYLQLSWADIESLVERLADKIISDYSPDLLVGVLRGGVTVAHLLSDVLGFNKIYPVGCSSYVDVAKRFSVKVYNPLALRDLSGKRVLLVDDVADEGLTLKEVIDQEISPKNPLEVRVATLHMKPWCKFKPDYYVEVTDAWIVYPWERWEVVRQVAEGFIRNLGMERGMDRLADLMEADIAKVQKVLASARNLSPTR